MPIHNDMSSVLFTVQSATWLAIHNCQLHSWKIDTNHSSNILLIVNLYILHVSQNDNYFHGQWWMVPFQMIASSIYHCGWLMVISEAQNYPHTLLLQVSLPETLIIITFCTFQLETKKTAVMSIPRFLLFAHDQQITQSSTQCLWATVYGEEHLHCFDESLTLLSSSFVLQFVSVAVIFVIVCSCITCEMCMMQCKLSLLLPHLISYWLINTVQLIMVQIPHICTFGQID